MNPHLFVVDICQMRLALPSSFFLKRKEVRKVYPTFVLANKAIVLQSL